MLQQILRDLYVDPEILAELDEQQKQTLFCKMREEQVRRWKVWDQEQQCYNKKSSNNNNNNNKKTKKKKKTVDFLKGIDGEPWVWVMGEHADDKSIEEILKEETIERARKIAEREAEELRKQVEATLSEYIDLTPKIGDLQPPSKLIEDDVDIYCSVEELREKINGGRPAAKNNIDNYTINHYQTKNNNKYNSMLDGRDVLQEISINTQKVAQKVALWEKRLTEERTTEIYRKIQRKQMEVAKEAEEAEKKQEQLWREQERKAKQAEQQIREIARRAREEHRLTSGLEFEAAYSNVTTSGVPPGKQAVLDWYRSKEIPRSAGLDSSNNVEPWFHGLITRLSAETLLQDQPDGSYLVRLSERIWGYAISYKAKDKCKHYLVNAGQMYQFLGNNQLEHKSLSDLIEHHERYALTGGEKLLHSCPRQDNAAMKEIFLDRFNY